MVEPVTKSAKLDDMYNRTLNVAWNVTPSEVESITEELIARWVTILVCPRPTLRPTHDFS